MPQIVANGVGLVKSIITFRNISCKYDPHVSLEVPRVSRHCAGGRRDRVSSTVAWHLSKYSPDVRRDLLVPAGLCASGLGAPGGLTCGGSHCSFQLLDELLLGRLHGSVGRGGGIGCSRPLIPTRTYKSRPIYTCLRLCDLTAHSGNVASL